MEFEVEIMSGAGNIFSVIDNRERKYPPDLIRKYSNQICTKSYPQNKTEGILLIEPSDEPKQDFSVKFFNPDGSFGMMCGNGGRCAVAFALEKGLFQPKNEPIKFDVWGQEYSAEIIGTEIKIIFPPPKLIIENKKIETETQHFLGDFIDVGSPHFVVNFDIMFKGTNTNFSNFPITELGRLIRYHKDFLPDGTNVDIFKIHNDQIFLRTYERGVEAETGACGTGAIATAVSVFLKNPNRNSFEIIPTSKEKLKVVILHDDKKIKEIDLIGGFKFLGKYKIYIDD
jgi:diaminopimelate epimerase